MIISYTILVRRGHSEVLSVNERIILKCILHQWGQVVGLINLDKGRDRWRSLADMVMNLRVP